MKQEMEIREFPLKDKLIVAFQTQKQTLFANESETLQQTRQEAFNRFVAEGFPRTNQEIWRNTDLTHALSQDYAVELHPQDFKDQKDLLQCNVPHLEAYQMVVANGWFYPKTGKLETLTGGIIVGSLAEAMKLHPELIHTYFDSMTQKSSEGLIALNTAMATDGFFVYIPDGVICEMPLQIVNVMRSQNTEFLNIRNLVIIGKNSSLTLIQCDDSYNHTPGFANVVTEVIVGENSGFEHYKMQNLNNETTLINSIFIHEEANSRVNSMAVSLNGGSIRNNIDIKLDGEGSNANVYGLYLMDKNQHVDNYVHIDHLKPHTTSNELFKGILDDSATAVFNGHVKVWPNAQKIEAFQSNKNLLLTDKALVNTKPFLEIYADDVKCSHGATVGQLDTEAMFYLRSRGISIQSARTLLMYAFADEVIQKIVIEALKVRLEDMVKKRLQGELTICDQCVLHCDHVEKQYSFEIDMTKIGETGKSHC